MSTPQARAAYRKWYKANRKKFNEKRKADYAEDPKKREAAAKKQALRRKTVPAKKVVNPDAGHHYRMVGKKKTEVFRIGQAASMVGRDIQAIRTWHSKEYIPEPTVPGHHRYYTMHQINLLIEFAELMSQVRYEPTIRAQAIATKAEEIAAQWSSTKET